MQELFESWRKYKNLLTELTTDSRYGNNYSELRKLIDEASHRTWIFFDSETTGLGYNKPHEQVTQVAAIAVDVKGFRPHEEPEILGKVNVKINLDDDTRGFMKWQRDKIAGGEEFDRTVVQNFQMSGYGIVRNPEKRRRKDFLNNANGGKLEDFPLDKTKQFHRMDSAMIQFVEFLDQYDERVVLAQNAPFDVNFINSMFLRLGKQPPNDMVVDTLQIFKRYLIPIIKEFKVKKENGEELNPDENRMLEKIHILNKGGKKYMSTSLGQMTQAFSIENGSWHDGLADCISLFKVLRATLKYLDNINMSNIQPDMTPSLPGAKPSDIEI